MKAIMISIKPKWCANIINGDKTIEVRKNKALANAIQKLIDENGYADIYVYCSKDKPNLWLPYEYDCFELDEASKPYLSNKPILDIDTKMNGKVIFKFRCYKVEEIKVDFFISKNGYYGTYLLSGPVLEKTSCLTHKDLKEYLRGDEKCNDVQNIGYAIHISDLEIFDRPREICEFHTNVKKESPEELLCPECGKPMEYYEYKYLTKAPQNFCYIEGELE